MLRLLAFLITGFWPSHRSLMALNKRVDRLELDAATHRKKLNRLWGAWYAERGSVPDVETEPGAPPSDFPEEEFQTQLALKRGGIPRGATTAG